MKGKKKPHTGRRAADTPSTSEPRRGQNKGRRSVEYWTARGWTFRLGMDEPSVLISPGDCDSQMTVDESGRVLFED